MLNSGAPREPEIFRLSASFFIEKSWRTSRAHAGNEQLGSVFAALFLTNRTQRLLKTENRTTCQEEEKEEKDSEREAPSVTEKSFVITSRVLPSPLFVVLPVVVVSSVSLV